MQSMAEAEELDSLPADEPSVPAWAQALQERVAAMDSHQRKLNQEIARLRKRAAKPETGDGDGETPKPAKAALDPLALLDLGGALAALPGSMRDALREDLQAGADPQSVLRTARLYAEHLPQVGEPREGEQAVAGERPPKPPQGRAEMAAHPTTPRRPRSQAEAVEWARSRPDDWAQAKSDPTFDVTALPKYTPR